MKTLYHIFSKFTLQSTPYQEPPNDKVFNPLGYGGLLPYITCNTLDRKESQSFFPCKGDNRVTTGVGNQNEGAPLDSRSYCPTTDTYDVSVTSRLILKLYFRYALAGHFASWMLVFSFAISGSSRVFTSLLSPLIAYQNNPSNSLYLHMFSFVVPT